MLLTSSLHREIDSRYHLLHQSLPSFYAGLARLPDCPDVLFTGRLPCPAPLPPKELSQHGYLSPLGPIPAEGQSHCSLGFPDWLMVISASHRDDSGKTKSPGELHTSRTSALEQSKDIADPISAASCSGLLGSHLGSCSDSSAS